MSGECAAKKTLIMGSRKIVIKFLSLIIFACVLYTEQRFQYTCACVVRCQVHFIFKGLLKGLICMDILCSDLSWSDFSHGATIIRHKMMLVFNTSFDSWPRKLLIHLLLSIFIATDVELFNKGWNYPFFLYSLYCNSPQGEDMW